MHIKDTDKGRIIAASEGHLLDIIADFIPLKKKGSSYTGICPHCGSKSFTVTPGKNIYKCFSCEKGGNSPTTFLMQEQGKSYPEALRYLADRFNIFIEEKKIKRNKSKKSFCEQQLKASGLTSKDTYTWIQTNINDTKTRKQVDVFQKGTIDQYGNVDLTGDDMLIWYYDLEGNQVHYQKPKTQKLLPLWRVRWQNPEAHKDKYGRTMKYKSPYGSGSHLFIPEKLRQAYKNKIPFDTLYIQEGEKKAEKATKHGLYSVGIMGIHNIAGKNKSLPEPFQQIVKACDVKNVVFILDSDWDHLSSNLKSGDSVDYRAKTFKSAVINYRDHFKTFYNLGINIEIYFGYIKPTEKGDKGIDDLLVNTLKTKEKELKEDILISLNTKQLDGKYIKLHRISTWTELKFNELWKLNSAKEFAEKHKETLKELPEFKIGKHVWRFNQDGEFESAMPISPEEQFWKAIEYEKSGRTFTKYEFKYKRCFLFLRNRGFYRYITAQSKFILIHINNRIVRKIEPWEARDFVIEFANQIAPEDAIEMLYRGGPQYLGPEKLSHLDFTTPVFYKPTPEHQHLFFKEFAWEITSTNVKQLNINEINNHIWDTQVIKADIKRTQEPLIKVFKITDEHMKNIPENLRPEFEKNHKNKIFYELTDTGKKCNFLKFLENASNFTWRKPIKEVSFDEQFENAQHFIAKLSALGYMLHGYKDQSQARAVIGSDGRMSEVGSSNGRSGKSLFGNAIGNILKQEYISGKSKDLTRDQFIFSEVDETTRNIFIDDARANIDFEFFFPVITGQMKINVKGGGRFTLGTDTTPKLYLTTNHAIVGTGSSFKDRQWNIAFSDYYNDTHKPIDDFGTQFFDGWDNTQWELFYNMAAEAIQIYLKYGVIQSPQERIELRKLRQQMGEDFLTWAEIFFDEDGENINKRITKNAAYGDFKNEYPNQIKYTTATSFKRKLKWYCQYKDYIFNPGLYDENGNPIKFGKDGEPILDDKSGGLEYIEIGTKDKK